MSVCRILYEIVSVKEWPDLETGVRVVQGHWTWRRSIDHIRLFIGPPLQVYLYVVQFSSYLTLNNRDLEEVTEGHSNWYHSKAWMRFPIRLP